MTQQGTEALAAIVASRGLGEEAFEGPASGDIDEVQ
jgi:hypothetical protein